MWLPLLTAISIAIILINICEYGVPNCGVWLLRTVEVMFWIYVGLSAVASAGLYLILWSTLYDIPSETHGTMSANSKVESFPFT